MVRAANPASIDLRLDPFTQAVVEQFVTFLNTSRSGGGDEEFDVATGAELAAVLS